MKKINLLSLALLATAGTMFTSCSNDDEKVDPVVVQENNVPNGTISMVYSIQVKTSSTPEGGKVTGFAGAKVTVNQNGHVQTKTTDRTGIVSFDGMKPGLVSVFVESPDESKYLSVNSVETIDCYYCDYADLDTDQLEYDQDEIVLPVRGGTITGTIYGDFDFDLGTPNTTITGGTVIAKISSDYEPNVFTATPSNTGVFTFSNLPEGVAITLSLDYQSLNTLPNPDVMKDWALPAAAAGPHTLNSVKNKLELGNITAQ
ncbi:MAG TPA: hypothetical protein VIK89_10885 [Cytophagaceae bacterium]